MHSRKPREGCNFFFFPRTLLACRRASPPGPKALRTETAASPRASGRSTAATVFEARLVQGALLKTVRTAGRAAGGCRGLPVAAAALQQRLAQAHPSQHVCQSRMRAADRRPTAGLRHAAAA